MTKLKLVDLDDGNPVKLTISLSAVLHRDLTAYAAILGNESGKQIQPAALIAPMLERFIESDRAFRKAKAQQNPSRSAFNPKS